MAACCAIGALAIYYLMSIHARLSDFKGTRPGPKKVVSELCYPISSQEEGPESLQPEDKTRTCRLFLRGLTCQSCVAAVEDSLLSTPGVQNASVSLHSLSACVTFDPQRVNQERLIAAVEQTGFEAIVHSASEDWKSQWTIAEGLKDENTRESTRRFHISAIVSCVLFLLELVETWISSHGTALSGYLKVLSPALAIISIPLLGAPIHREAYAALVHCRPSASLLSSAGLLSVLAAALDRRLSETSSKSQDVSASFSTTSACMLMTVLAGGRLTKSFVSQRSTNFPASLASAMPDTAQLLLTNADNDTQASSIPAHLLRTGDRIVIQSGTSVPADCIITTGNTSVLETIVKGETTPTAVGPADSILAGCTVHGGQVIAEVVRVGQGTWLGQALQAMTQADKVRSAEQYSSDRWLASFSTIVLAFAISVGAISIAIGASTQMVLNRTATIMLCACPCSLAMGVSICIMTATCKSGFTKR